MASDVEAQNLDGAGGRRQQAEENLDKSALSRTIGAHETYDTRLQLEV
jgi:hypothetical protein